jgi:hypothetical protein
VHGERPHPPYCADIQPISLVSMPPLLMFQHYAEFAADVEASAIRDSTSVSCRLSRADRAWSPDGRSRAHPSGNLGGISPASQQRELMQAWPGSRSCCLLPGSRSRASHLPVLASRAELTSQFVHVGRGSRFRASR